MNNPNFKLIAIRPLEECANKFLKNLSKGTIYKFYNEYKFKNSEGKEIISGTEKVSSVFNESKVPSTLYKLGNNLSEIEINISALVGKNGSGKSSLLELLYASCYVIASRKQILKDIAYYRKKLKKNNNTGKHYLDKIMEIQSVYEDLNVEIFYQIDNCVYGVRLEKFNLYHYILSGSNENFNNNGIYKDSEELDSKLRYILNEVFFYTISINYSLYGLNEKFLGGWVKELFHKNDGYQTPLVINPFRKEGNINVNSELHLAQTRLLTNIIKNPVNNTVNGKQINTVVFELDNKKYKERVDDDLDILYNEFKKEYGFNDSNFVTNVYNKLYGGIVYGNIEILNKNTPNFEYQCKYVFRKIIKISQYYSEYNKHIFINQNAKRVEFDNFFTFISELTEDRSHITLKLRQVLNNLRFNILNEDETINWITSDKENENGNQYYKVTLESLIDRLKVYNIDGNFLYEELIPIGCFNSILWVKNNKNKESIKNLDVLSSGEQHFIHSIQSILYHISNINSVFESKTNKIKYNYVNIVLDEIELYYHPEFQRTFLSELLIRIRSLAIPNIKGINILFCTHSPFILSDIPIQNTLKLVNGQIQHDRLKSNNTLGANIHDLLDNDFYLDKGFMGEFANKKINTLITFLSQKNKKTIIKSSWNKINAKQFIELIGEPLLKGTLKDLYFERFPNTIDDEIERLIRLKEQSSDTD